MLNTCSRALRDRLVNAGGWLSRDDLVRGLDWTEARVDDELADLVTTGYVLFNSRGRQYRLAGERQARSAVRMLIQSDELGMAVSASPDASKPALMRVGIAVRNTGPDGNELIAMVELEVPCATGQERAGLAMAIDQALRDRAPFKTTTTFAGD